MLLNPIRRCEWTRVFAKNENGSHINPVFDNIGGKLFGRWVDDARGTVILSLNLNEQSFEWLDEKLLHLTQGKWKTGDEWNGAVLPLNQIACKSVETTLNTIRFFFQRQLIGFLINLQFIINQISQPKRISKDIIEQQEFMKKSLISAAAILFLTIFTIMAQNNPKNLEIDWNTDTSKHTVSLKEFTALLVPDGIPPIDEPKFWNREKALENFFEHEPVIAVTINGRSKSYPLSILTFHEIVNDNLGGKPISVTYCPLCNAALVFDRDLSFEGKKYLLDFGVSGMLRKSDLVMWDRQTQSWWQQFTGTALVGELARAQLNFVSSMLISLKEFFESYPEGLVLSTETGHFREYGTNPYTGYDDLSNMQPRLFKGEVDSRLPAMERIIDVHVNGKYKIYPLSVISQKRVINDTFKEQPLVLFHTLKTVSVLDDKQIVNSREIGSVTVFVPEVNDQLLTFSGNKDKFIDEQTGSVWNIAGTCISGKLKGEKLHPVTHGNHFAFAWFSFHPDSEIYKE